MFTSTGVNVGNVIVGITSGYLCSVPADNGWPLIFYVHGESRWWWVYHDHVSTVAEISCNSLGKILELAETFIVSYTKG